jgi:hypothetical protein
LNHELNPANPVYPACPAVPSEIDINHSEAYFAGVAPADGTGVKNKKPDYLCPGNPAVPLQSGTRGFPSPDHSEFGFIKMIILPTEHARSVGSWVCTF